MEIFIDGKEVIASGAVIAYLNELIEFKLGANVEANIKFISDKDVIGSNVKAELTQIGIILLNFINFDDPLGISNGTPIPLGTLKGRRIYFEYVVYGLGQDKKKLLNYTLKLDKLKKDE